MTRLDVCRAAGLSESADRQHKDIHALIDPIIMEQENTHEEHLLMRVQEAIEQIRCNGQKVFRPAVCQQVGMSIAGIRRYPSVIQAVREARLADRAEFEDRLIQRIRIACQELQNQNIPLTQEVVCERISLSPNTLRYYVRAKMLMDRVATQVQFRR